MQKSLLPVVRDCQTSQGVCQIDRLKWTASRDVLSDPAIQNKLAQLGLKVRASSSLDPWSIVAGVPGDVQPPGYPEGYSLTIRPEGLTLRGFDRSGLFWGLITLTQLLREGKTLQSLTIRDWPTFAVRYHHDDISRKQISTVADFKRIIETLSLWKISHYTPYMEDVLHLKSFPDIGEGRGKLMPDEVAQIIAHGRLHNVEVFPTFSLIGHQENLLRLPKYAHLGRKVFQPSSSLDVKNPAVRRFLEKVIADVCQLFPSRLFHMCFDETQGLACDEFIDHANWCAQQLLQHGKTPLIWVDMFNNHFGHEQIKRLHPAIIPVNWQYDFGQPKHQRELEQMGRPVWGLGGYRTWCAFVPNQREARGNFEGWVHGMGPGNPWNDVGLGASQWGDNGYENLRNLPQNAFAAFAEHAWSGKSADMSSFDDRFETLYYGKPQPKLREIALDLPETLSLAQGKLWKLHRARPEEIRRRIAAGELKPRQATADLKKVSRAMADLKRIKPPLNRDHLDHFRVGLLRTASVLQRIAGVPATQVVAGLKKARREYLGLWLRDNKPENVEVSLKVFDDAIGYWTARPQAADTTRFLPLKLPFNTLHIDAGGIPIGPAVVNGVSFAFADHRKTHLELKPGEKLRLKLPKVAVRDLHLIVSAPRIAEPRPALRVSLERARAAVFTEDLLRLRHLCDWWAPFGNHMWAGGGFAYVDPTRVRPGIIAADYFGMMHLDRFGLTGAPVCDALELEVIDDKPVQLFAITIEKVVR